jgi:2-dehydropantoate 2-reductase
VRALPVLGAARRGGSSWQSLARRAGSIETDHLNGEIVWLGERHGVATPYNRAITGLALRAAAEGWPPERLSADALEAEIGAAIRA